MSQEWDSEIHKTSPVILHQESPINEIRTRICVYNVERVKKQQAAHLSLARKHDSFHRNKKNTSEEMVSHTNVVNGVSLTQNVF